MKKLQKLGAASRAPPLPTKNPPAVLGPRAGIPPPQRHQTQQRVKFRTLHLQIRTILIVAAALRNTLHTTENKQQHSFLIDSKFANFGPQEKNLPPGQLPRAPLPHPLNSPRKSRCHWSYHFLRLVPRIPDHKSRFTRHSSLANVHCSICLPLPTLLK